MNDTDQLLNANDIVALPAITYNVTLTVLITMEIQGKTTEKTFLDNFMEPKLLVNMTIIARTILK